MLWTRPTSYRCGHFANAWEKLRAKYETDKKPDLQEEQEKYYSKRMKEKESPETFILGMEIMRRSDSGRQVHQGPYFEAT